MPRSSRALGRMAKASFIYQDALPGVPVVEIAGMGRVLIEGHKGVTEYGENRIQVSMRYGSLMVIGQGLSLAHMSTERLVITGTVDQVCLCRR